MTNSSTLPSQCVGDLQAVGPEMEKAVQRVWPWFGAGFGKGEGAVLLVNKRRQWDELRDGEQCRVFMLDNIR